MTAISAARQETLRLAGRHIAKRAVAEQMIKDFPDGVTLVLTETDTPAHQAFEDLRTQSPEGGVFLVRNGELLASIAALRTVARGEPAASGRSRGVELFLTMGDILDAVEAEAAARNPSHGLPHRQGGKSRAMGAAAFEGFGLTPLQ